LEEWHYYQSLHSIKPQNFPTSDFEFEFRDLGESTSRRENISTPTNLSLLEEFKGVSRRKRRIFRQTEGKRSPIFERYLEYMRDGKIEEIVPDTNLTDEENPFSQSEVPNWNNLFPDFSNGLSS
jgi:hypothetical protein